VAGGGSGPAGSHCCAAAIAQPPCGGMGDLGQSRGGESHTITDTDPLDGVHWHPNRRGCPLADVQSPGICFRECRAPNSAVHPGPRPPRSPEPQSTVRLEDLRPDASDCELARHRFPFSRLQRPQRTRRRASERRRCPDCLGTSRATRSCVQTSTSVNSRIVELSANVSCTKSIAQRGFGWVTTGPA